MPAPLRLRRQAAHSRTRVLSKSAKYISIYATGLGDVSNRPAAGAASPTSPLSYTVAAPEVTIGGVSAPVIFSGLAPGFVGLYQINVKVPDGVPTGAEVPTVLKIGGVASNAATIAIDPLNNPSR